MLIQIWPIILSGSISAFIAILTGGDLFYIAMSSYILSLIFGALLIYQMDDKGKSDTIFLSFISTGVSAILLIYLCTWLLFNILSDFKQNFIVDNSSFITYKSAPILLIGFSSILLLYNFFWYYYNQGETKCRK